MVKAEHYRFAEQQMREFRVHTIAVRITKVDRLADQIDEIDRKNPVVRLFQRSAFARGLLVSRIEQEARVTDDQAKTVDLIDAAVGLKFTGRGPVSHKDHFRRMQGIVNGVEVDLIGSLPLSANSWRVSGMVGGKDVTHYPRKPTNKTVQDFFESMLPVLEEREQIAQAQPLLEEMMRVTRKIARRGNIGGVHRRKQ